MTLYNEEYDGSDNGQWDGTSEACSTCDNPDCFDYNGDYFCDDCLERLFSEEIDAIAWGYLGEQDISRSVTAMEAEMCDLQVEILRSPLHADFIGFALVFGNYETEVTKEQLEWHKNKEQ